MGAVWDDLLKPTSIKELIFLAPFKVFCPPPPDLSAVRVTGGDYRTDELSEAVGTKEIVGNVIETWLERGEDRPTLVYGVDRKHAQHLQERFVEAGIATEYVDCYTELFSREEIFQRFTAGETKIICNVATLDTGIDLDVRCIVDARPTRSRIRFVQTIGRGLRTADGKDHLLVLDHAGNHLRLGKVTGINFATLDDGKQRGSQDTKPSAEAPVKVCPECRSPIPPGSRTCP